MALSAIANTTLGTDAVLVLAVTAILVVLLVFELASFAALGVLLVFDRILDMARTSINVWGDCSCATIVARLEGEKTNVAVVDENA